MRTAIFNGKVYVDRGKFAQAILIENDRITQTGSDAEILNCSGIEKRIDCQGRTVIPGLNDSHLHLLMVGVSLSQVQINGCSSIDDLVNRCREFIAENPESVRHGLLGMGWNQDLFTSGEVRNPNRHDLDRISTEIPILLYRVCGHTAVANTCAIQKLGLTAKSPQFVGGFFETEADGYPTGLFAENACEHIRSVFPNPTIEEYKQMLVKAMRYAASQGVTSVQSNDAGGMQINTRDGLEMVKQLYESGNGIIRYHHQIGFKNLNEFQEMIATGDYQNGRYEVPDWLTLGPLKLFKDGSLGARTAMIRNGYQDDPGNFGVETISNEVVEQYCIAAADAGIPVAIHAIGDGAVEQVLDAYQKVLVDGTNPLRHSIVHCQITDRGLLERIARMGILVHYQPVFLDYDMQIVESRVGSDLASTSYAFHTLDTLGGKISYGTDSPVENCNPFACIFSAVTRKERSGKIPAAFFPQECVDVETAVDAYTIGSAYAQFMEQRKGRIREGYLADLLILDQDIFTVSADQIQYIHPELTMVGGKIVYQTGQIG